MSGDQQPAESQLHAFLEQTLVPRGHDPVTASSDLWSHSRISPVLRDAALNLHGSDIFKKVKPPGDTRLYRGEGWTLESLVNVRPAEQPPPQFSSAQLAMAFALPPGRHILPEEAKGPRVGQPTGPR